VQCGTLPNLQNSTNFGVHQDRMLELIALAVQCNVAPSITYIMDFEFSYQNYGFMGVDANFHDVTHHDANATDLQTMHRSVNNHYAKQFSRLVQKLQSITDANGVSALSNLVLSMGSGMGDSNEHSRKGGIPFVIAGGANLGVPQSKTYQPQVTMAELIRTIMSYCGLEASQYKGYGGGDSTIVDKLKAL
jgi:hypothetical protein